MTTRDWLGLLILGSYFLVGLLVLVFWALGVIHPENAKEVMQTLMCWGSGPVAGILVYYFGRPRRT